jgi:aldehyde dehydrogenase
MTTAINEDLIRDVVSDVLKRLQSGTNGPIASAASAGRAHAAFDAGQDGVFDRVDDAVAAAVRAQQQLLSHSLDDRKAAVQCVRDIVIKQAEELGRIEFEETRIGRLDHKIEKLTVVGNKVPGIEMLVTHAVSGDNGLCVTEHAPYGVIGVITPVTHSVPTLACNAIMMISSGNTLVCNPHPSGAKCAAIAVQRWNRAIREKTGIDNLICLIRTPTLETANEIFTHRDIAMLCVTGGPGVAKAAMSSSKKAVVAGPGNPPAVVDATADIEKAAAGIIFGCAYDNNLLCIGEKEVFVVDAVADKLLEAMSRHGGYRLTTEQMDKLASIALHQDPKSKHWIPDRKFVGADPQVLGEAIGVKVPTGVQILYGETKESNPLVPCEQMTPVLPVVRCRTFEEAVAKAVQYEHGFGHTAILWSQSVDHMTYMGKAVDTTLFIKNGACMTGLGLGGEGFVSYSIATPTGEGPTSPLTFTRVRRCVMVDNLRII